MRSQDLNVTPLSSHCHRQDASLDMGFSRFSAHHVAQVSDRLPGTNLLRQAFSGQAKLHMRTILSA